MVIDPIRKAFWFIGLILLQVLVLNNIHLFGFATPFLYIYFILKLSSNISRNALMLLGFVLGLTIDIFSNTVGMNAAAAVFVAFCRPAILRLYITREATESILPSFASMGRFPFIKYTLTFILVHHSLLMLTQFYSLDHLSSFLLNLIGSTIFTFACIYALEVINIKNG